MIDPDGKRACDRCRAEEDMLPPHPGADPAKRILRPTWGPALGQINQTITLCLACLRHLFGPRYVEPRAL